MAENGVKTTGFPSTSSLDEFLGNNDGNSASASFQDIVDQIASALHPLFASEEAVSDIEGRINLVEQSTAYASLLKATWPDLLAITGSADGQRAEVMEADSGSHNNATATGYDGTLVANRGQYAWNAIWSRWERVGDSGLASIENARTRELVFDGASTASAWIADTNGGPVTVSYDTDALYIVRFTSVPAAGATINIDGLGALPIEDRKGATVQADDIPVNEAFLGRVKSGGFQLFTRFKSAQPVADAEVVDTMAEARPRDLGVASGSGAAWTASTTGSLPTTVYRTDVLYIIQFASEPAAGATIAVDGLSALPIQDRKGAAVQAGDIPINEAFLARVRSGGFRLFTRFASAAGLPEPLAKQNGPLRLDIDGASTASAVIATTTPAFTGYTVGQPLFFRPLTALDAGATININGLGALPIEDGLTGAAIDPRQIAVGASYIGLVQFGGFQLLNLQSAASGTMEERVLTEPLPLPAVSTRLGLQGYGQSLEAGYRRTASALPRILSTTAVYGGLTFSDGPRSTGTALLGEIGLIETADYPYIGGGDPTSYGETSASGFVAGFTEEALTHFGYVHEEGPSLFAANAARGGTASTRLVPTDHPNFVSIGTEPIQPFDLLKQQIDAAVALASVAGDDFALYAITADQGQGEEPSGTLRADWLENWLAIYDAVSAYARAQSGQNFDPMMLFSQVYAGTRVADGQMIADAQRDLETARPGRCFMFMPTHHMAAKQGYGGILYHSDGHLTAYGSYYVGYMRGRAWAHALFTGREPARMRPIGASYDGSAVTLHLHAPQLPVVIDTSESVIGVGRVKDGGLAVEDDTGVATLTSVVVGADGKSVVLTPDRALSGTIRIRGGRDYLAPAPGLSEWDPGNSSATSYQQDYSSSAVLALRDSTADTVLIEGVAYPAAHWCPSFDMRVSSLNGQ